MQEADCESGVFVPIYLFENVFFLFSLKQVDWYWQWHSITWPTRLFLRPESRGFYLVTALSKQIQHNNFLGISLLCIQVKFWWNSRNCSHTKSSSRNYILQIEDFASRPQTCNFSVWKLQATAWIIHTYSFSVTGLWWMFLLNIRFYAEFIFQVLSHVWAFKK